MRGTFQPGQTLGPYRILHKLGTGGMAEVYLAKAFGASGFCKHVALKVLLPHLRQNAQLQRLLIEEARMGARLQHQNLVQVHDLGLVDGLYFVRMDYVDGRDLATLMARERPSQAVALLIAREVALALAYMHDACDDDGRPLGLVHRDVSPSNILLSRWGEVRLADFGIAKATMLADITQANVRKGKYAYMSPEQVAGDPLAPSSDQFGFGATLMELLAGRRPFDGATPLETMEQVRQAEAPALADIARRPAEVILRCLQRSPERRFSSAGQLCEALATCQAEQPADSADLATWVRRQLDRDAPDPCPTASDETVAE